MTTWKKVTLVSGQSVHLDIARASAVKRVLGQGKEFTSVYFGGNSEPFEILETPEDLLGISPRAGAI